MSNCLRKDNEEYPSLRCVCIVVCCKCLSIVGYKFAQLASRPHIRRNDYPLDQDCHLCHAVVRESMNKIGNIISIENTKNVLKSICKTSKFEGYQIFESGDET